MDTWEVLCILSSFLWVGLFSGPWIALSDSFKTFHPKLFVGIVEHLSRSITPALTVVMPMAILSMIPLLIETSGTNSVAFGFNIAAFVLTALSLTVTVLFELPSVNEITAWNSSSVPENWRQRRDRWILVHKIRVFTGFGGLLSLVIAALTLRTI